MRKGRKWLPAVLSVAMVLQPFAGIGSVTAMAADGVNIDDTFRNDSIFKKYVSNNFDTNSDGYLDADEISAVRSIDIHDIDSKAEYGRKAVQNVDGIEVFTNLTEINCSGQGIKNMDIQNLTKLEYLDVSNNMMSDLTLPVAADDLAYLDISGNDITRLTSLSNYDNLTHLDASGTNLESVDVRSMKGLTYLSVSGLSLKTLDLSENMQLKTLRCQAMSGLSTLDVSDHTALESLYCDATASSIKGSITKLDVSGDTSLISLNCASNNLADLDITDTPNLTILDCSETRLQSLDIANNSKLTSLTVDGTPLGTLDISSNTALSTLSASGIGLQDVNISSNAALKYVNLNSNDLKSIDISSNAALETLYLSDNILESIDLSRNVNLRDLTLDRNRLVCIDVSDCTKLFNSEEGGSFSCIGNSRDITLDKPNYDFDLTKYNSLYNFHRAYNDSEIKVWNETKEQFEYGRKNTTIGYAGLALGEENGAIYTATGGTINNYSLNADLDSTEIKYQYYCGYGTRKVKFTLNILNPLTVQVYYSVNGKFTQAGSSTLNCVVGSTTKLVARDKDGNLHENITWSSNNSRVVSVNNLGEVTCKESGTAQITTNLNGRPVGYINIECHNPVNRMSFIDRDNKNDDGTDIAYGDNSVIDLECGRYAGISTKNLTAKFYNTDGVVAPKFSGYTCVISDSKDNCDNESNSVVSFRNGQLASVGPGIAYLHFTSKDNPETKMVIQVNVIQRADSIQVSRRTLSMIAGRTATLTAIISPAATANQNVTWVSGDDSIVSVDENGKLTAHKAGTVDITCIADDNPNVLKSKCTVTVLEAVAGVTMDRTECTLTLPKDRSVQLSVKIDAEDESKYTQKWVSSDSEVAKVASNGYVTAIKRGTAVITCYLSDDLFASCEVTVNQNVTNIELNVEKNELIIGEKMQAVTKVTPENANNKQLIWSSSDDKIATVDQEGNITAVGKGSVTIKATAADGSGKYRQIGLRVKKLVSDVKLEKDSMIAYIGRASRMDISVIPADASNGNLIWESSDVGIATVSGGRTTVAVTGVKPGEATITAKTKDGSDIVRSFTVTVYQQITGISFNEARKDVKVGAKFKNTYTIQPDTANSREITWSTSNEAVATVASDGTVTAVGRGVTVISAVPSDGVGTRSTYVVNVIQPVKKITLSATKLSLAKGSKYTLAATVLPANANNKKVTWKTSNPKIVNVSNGYLTAVAKGTATITCTAKDGSGKYATCTVKVVQPATSIKLGVYQKTMLKGSTYTLKYAVGPASASNKKVVWSSSNKKVATVTATGVVKAVGKGTAVITCKTADGTNLTASCTITSIVRVSRVKLNKTSVAVKRGGRVALKATVAPTIANNRAVAWTSSNKSIATVAANGVVTGKKKGKAVITCKAKDGSGKYARCTVVVK